MQRVLVHANLILVGHLRAVLEARGIACHVRNEHLAGAIGELPAHECWPELWVLDDAHVARALDLLDGLLASHDAPPAGEPWTCPQ